MQQPLDALAGLASTAVLAFLAVWVLWVFYLAVMCLERARRAGTLRPWAYRLGLPVLYVGWLLDFLVNVAVFTFVMLEPPRELTVSARLSRHIAHGRGWRQRLAMWFCHTLLDTFDPSGCHCR
jgi:hypothetical protein